MASEMCSMKLWFPWRCGVGGGIVRKWPDIRRAGALNPVAKTGEMTSCVPRLLPPRQEGMGQFPN